MIEGVGNLEQTKSPQVFWPKTVESFDPTDRDDMDKNGEPVVIRKTFNYPFVVNKPGNYVIPAIQFNFFNPSTGKYETVLSKPLSFNAKKGSNAIFSIVNNQSSNDFDMRLYIILGSALLAVALGLLYFNRKPRPAAIVVGHQNAPQSFNDVVVKQPAVTDQYIHNISDLNPIENKNFYKHLYKELIAYLQTRFNVDEGCIDSIAQARPQDAECLVKLKSLLADCKLGMYTPIFNTEEEMKHRLLAIEILSKLEKNNVE